MRLEWDLTQPKRIGGKGWDFASGKRTKVYTLPAKLVEKHHRLRSVNQRTFYGNFPSTIWFFNITVENP